MHLHPKVKSFTQFFYSSHFYESIKITVGILTPSILLAQFGKLDLGIALSLGAVCQNIVDSPGPMVHRRNAMLVTAPLLFIFTVLSCISGTNPISAVLFITLSSFAFSMLYVYGTRAASVGVSILLMIVLSIDDQRSITEILYYGLAIFIGSMWYTALSYTFHKVRPYRFAQQAIAEYLMDLAEFLKIKADFYHHNFDFEKNYKKLISKQITITEEQDALRDLLFTTRNIVKESTPEGMFLTQVFRDSVDLFEQLISTQYHYEELRNKLGKSTILSKYRDVILHIAEEVEGISYALNLGEIPKMNSGFETELQKIEDNIQTLKEEQEEYGFDNDVLFALKNIITNIKSIIYKVAVIQNYFSRKKEKNWIRNQKKTPNLEAFITRKKRIDFSHFKENLSFKSNYFRFALRFSLIMTIGYLISKTLNTSHSYWVLLSILVILKSGFSQTKQRNIHRVIGTFFGALIGLAILNFIHNQYVLFFTLLLFMILAFSFMRKNYVLYVLFMTPYLFAMYSFMKIGTTELVGERILDTIIGATLAFAGTYVLLPNWEHFNAKSYINNCLIALNGYFTQVSKLYIDELNFDNTEFKLARKNAHIELSNMASMVNNMFEEPKSKQFYLKEIQQINSLMHLFASYIASLYLYDKEQQINKKQIIDLAPVISQVKNYLNASSINISTKVHFNQELKKINLTNYQTQDGFKAVRDMLLTMQNLASEIFKISKKLELMQDTTDA